MGDGAALVPDGGPCAVGVESTVVDLSGPGPPRLLRPGGIGRERLEALLGRLDAPPPTARPHAPGQLESHYAPRLPVRLDALDLEPGEALLAFGPVPLSGGV